MSLFKVTEILGAPDIYIEEGVTMNLTCMVRWDIFAMVILVDFWHVDFGWLFDDCGEWDLNIWSGTAPNHPSSSSGSTTTRLPFIQTMPQAYA